jgi:beta-RFAP synthase
MIRIQTASRLHFGLLSLAPPDAPPCPDRRGEPVLPVRRFGGVGLMVERPGVRLGVTPAAAWSAEGPLAERALAFARRLAQGVRPGEATREVRPQRLVVEAGAPEHAGLGVGTQLGLAVGRALAAAWGLATDVRDLARRLGRGLRSALGVYGFEQGGFLVEGGKRAGEELSPLLARVAFPEDWRVVLALPAGDAGLHGPGEQEAFARLASRPTPPGPTDVLCRLVLLGLLPALVEHDLAAFSAALHDFNARVGEAFATVQGGTYAGPGVAALVEFIRAQGVEGVGQSSWGPAVFAVVGDEDRATHLARRVRDHLGLGAAGALVTRACNHGAEEGAA